MTIAPSNLIIKKVSSSLCLYTSALYIPVLSATFRFCHHFIASRPLVESTLTIVYPSCYLIIDHFLQVTKPNHLRMVRLTASIVFSIHFFPFTKYVNSVIYPFIIFVIHFVHTYNFYLFFHYLDPVLRMCCSPFIVHFKTRYFSSSLLHTQHHSQLTFLNSLCYFIHLTSFLPTHSFLPPYFALPSYFSLFFLLYRLPFILTYAICDL